MPSFQDSAFIFFLALLLFGPKKLPELARYVGKLMAEFRRASNEFRSQMEEEFRVAEQVEQQKKIAAIEAAAPVTPPIPDPEHPHVDPIVAPDLAAAESVTPEPFSGDPEQGAPEGGPAPHPIAPDRSYPPGETASPEPLPIASSGDLHLMPPATGLPVSRSAGSNPQSPAESKPLSGVFDSIPHISGPEATAEPETTTHA